MLQIPADVCFNTSISYADCALLYLPKPFYTPVITPAQQHEILQLLSKEINTDLFYFCIDVKNNSINNCNGIARCLGYNDAHFSLKNYCSIIHPVHAIVQAFYTTAVFDLLIKNEILLKFMQPVFTTNIALKHKNEKHFYCKRECFPFQLSNESKMTEYLCRFTIMKEFANEDYGLRICNDAGQLNEPEEKVRSHAKKEFEANAGFSVQELRIIKRYAQNANASSQAIANSFKIEKTTVETYNKRIIKKTENRFGQKFDNAKKSGRIL